MRYVTILAYTKEEADPIFFKFVKSALKKMGIKYTQPLSSSNWFSPKCGESQLTHNIPITEKQYKNHKALMKKISTGYVVREEGTPSHYGDYPDRHSDRRVSQSSYKYKLRNKENDIAYIISFHEFFDSADNPPKTWAMSFTQRYKKTPPQPPKRTNISKDLKEKVSEFAKNYYKRVNSLVKRHRYVEDKDNLCNVTDKSTKTAIHFYGFIKEPNKIKGRDIEKGLVGSAEKLGYRFYTDHLGYKADIKTIDNIPVDGYIYIKHISEENGIVVEVEVKVENVCKQ